MEFHISRICLDCVSLISLLPWLHRVGGDDYEPEFGTIGEHPDDHPEVGATGEHPDDHPEVGATGEDHGYDGAEDDPGTNYDPTHTVDEALICFHGKHIYSHCDETCRLTVNGELHVPPDQVDDFCNGPCIEETNLVLDCIDGIMEHFLFFNKATTQDVRDTILAGCGHGYERGNFDVAEHIEAYGNIGHKVTLSVVVVLSGIMLSILGHTSLRV